MTTATTSARPLRPIATVGVAAAAALPPLGGMVLGDTAYRWVLLAVVLACGSYIAVIDERTLRLPNRLVYPLAAAGAVQAILTAALAGDAGVALSAVIAAALVFLLYAAMAALGWCGFGDAKFAAVLALFAGTCAGVLAAYIVPVAIVLSGVRVGLSRIRGKRTTRHPHGFSIVAAAAVIILVAALVA